MYVLYILYSEKIDRFYVGHTNDIERRIYEHNRIKGKYTDVGIPWILVHSEYYPDKKSHPAGKDSSKAANPQFIVDLVSGGKPGR